MQMHDAWFFIGVFVFIFLVWIATGGPLRPIAFTVPELPKTGSVSGGSATYLRLPRAPYGIGNSEVVLQESAGGTYGQNAYVAPAVLAPPSIIGGIFGASSPYRGVVRLNHYISGAGSLDPKNEYVEISVAQDAGASVNITGWILTSDASGATSKIPKGTEVPISGTVNASQDIIITPGKRAIIISGSSPIGASFRENKCIGYFSSFQQFYPALPQNCPVSSDELVTYYGTGYIRDVACIEHVKTLSRCQVALSPPVGVSNTCQAFMTQYLNYNGCISAHQKDANFIGDTWRVYLGRTSPLWRTKYEIVKLLDATGKTVDAFSY